MTAWVLAVGGCAQDRFYNTTAWVEGRGKAYETVWLDRFLKANYYYPVRDAFNPQVWASLADPNEPAAWNVDSSGGVPDGSFYVNRDIDEITPAQAAAGPCTGPAPQPPWKVIKPRPGKKPTSFIGEDATGRRKVARIETPNGYTFTAESALGIATRLLKEDCVPGFHTPAGYFGPDLILDFTGCTRKDVR